MDMMECSVPLFYFQIHILEWKYVYFIEDFTEFVSNGLINNTQALVQIIAWRRPGDKPLSEPMMVSLLTHIWVTRPQWVYGLPPVQYQRMIAEK